LDLAAAAPLLCAGITVYSPMVNHGLKPHMTLGVVGMGGLGHMAVKIGKAMGCHVTVVSRNAAKKKTCIEDLKADSFIDMSNADEVKASAKNFDMIVNTISAFYDVNAYAKMLKCHGTMIIVGAPPMPLTLTCGALIGGAKTIAGSLIGGIKQT
jgi:D-arabinose 1-dehydrogenase-like Zn-dependent alcohol dehydrogenase